jgi:membrane protease YdiL (CAAX protease family)
MFAEPAEEVQPAGRGRLGSTSAYALALVISLVAILSQYVVPAALPGLRPLYGTLVGGLFVTYGIPILAFAVLVGVRPLDRFADRLGSSFAPSLAWYGVFSLLAIGVIVLLLIVYTLLDPAALDLLNQPNPVLESAQPNPWVWVVLSFAIGAFEETIFRGWIFGYWIARGSRNLGWHAAWTSALFAGVHLYYGATYLAAAPFSYTTLFLLGFAFAMAVRAGRGNLVWVILLHGATDAIAFLTLVSVGWSEGLHFGLILLGVGVAIVLYVRSRPSPPPPPPFSLAPPPWGPAHYGGTTYPPLAVPVVPPPTPSPPPPPPG